MIRFGVFLSHPIQYFSPLWRALAAHSGVAVKVFYYSRQGLEKSVDRDFGVSMAWDIDLVDGYAHEFLPRVWPTRSPLDYTWKGLNGGITDALDEGWDLVWISGYVHLNNWRVAYGCHRRGIPVVCMADSNFLVLRDQRGLRPSAKRLVLPFLLQKVAAVLPVSENGRPYFESLGVRSDRIHIVPYPCEVERFRQVAREASVETLANVRRKYGIPQGKRLVTFSGKLVPRKRPEDLIHAVSSLNRDDVAAVLIGDGPMRPQLERLDARRFVITGFVNQSEIPLLLSLGDISVLPSSNEPFGLSTTESMCLGIPAIVSDRVGAGGPTNLVRDGESGYVYPCGDVQLLSERIRYLLEDEPLRRRMGQRASELTQLQSPIAVARRLLEVARPVIRS